MSIEPVIGMHELTEQEADQAVGVAAEHGPARGALIAHAPEGVEEGQHVRGVLNQRAELTLVADPQGSQIGLAVHSPGDPPGPTGLNRAGVGGE